MKKYIPKLTVAYVLKAGILLLICFFASKIGFGQYTAHPFTTFIRPAAGIALAFLILYGYDLWPGIFIGIFFSYLFAGLSVLPALSIALVCTLQIVVGTYLLQRYIVLFRCFERLP